MPPTPETTCTACGKPVDPSEEACKACGAMVGAPSSGFSLDADADAAPPPAKPAAPPPPPADEAKSEPVAEPELKPEPDPEAEPEPASEAPGDAPKGETVRMSLADATQAWLEDTPNTTAVIHEDIDDLKPPGGKRALLLVVLGIAVAALIALVLIL